MCCLADFDTCWRSTEAVEVSHIPQVNSNQLYLSHIFQDFFMRKKINVPFCCVKLGSDVKNELDSPNLPTKVTKQMKVFQFLINNELVSDFMQTKVRFRFSFRGSTSDIFWAFLLITDAAICKIWKKKFFIRLSECGLNESE